MRRGKKKNCVPRLGWCCGEAAPGGGGGGLDVAVDATVPLIARDGNEVAPASE